MDNKVFDSSMKEETLVLNAPYYNAINPTTVLFAQEQISVYVDALGHVEFFDAAGSSLGLVDIPVHRDPSAYGHSAQYGTVKCTADGSIITFYFPEYYWIDSYPHCDGESDRWDRYTSGWFRVVFDCNTQKISILDKTA